MITNFLQAGESDGIDILSNTFKVITTDTQNTRWSRWWRDKWYK